MNGAAQPRRRGLVLPAVLALAAFIVLIALGAWQMERKAWKDALIAALAERLAAAPSALPPRAGWASLDQADEEFRRVVFSAEFMHAHEALVYTSGSSLRPDVKEPGYWVFTPARLSDGGLVVVDRGFVPEGRQDPKTRAQGQVAGVVHVTGILRWPEARGFFTPGDEPAKNLWFVRDHPAMAAAKGLGAVAPFVVSQEFPAAPGGLPRAGPVKPNLPNNHFSYALTWYGLALVLVAVFAAWMVSQRRAAKVGNGE